MPDASRGLSRCNKLFTSCNQRAACMDAAIEQLSEAFQCPICYELISSRHRARTLPCGHGNVCEKDLTAIWRQQQGQGFKCPSQGCNLPNCPPIDKLPLNWAFISAGDAFEDLLGARESASSSLSGPAKRAMQLVDSISGGSSSTPPADVIRCAHAVYSSLTQSQSAPAADAVRKPKISDASARQLQEAEARIAVLKRIMSGQSPALVFLKL